MGSWKIENVNNDCFTYKNNIIAPWTSFYNDNENKNNISLTVLDHFHQCKSIHSLCVGNKCSNAKYKNKSVDFSKQKFLGK